MTRANPDSLLPLTPAMFQVLIALADGEKHGYAILKEVARRTDGEVVLSAATLYTIIRRFVQNGVIAERRAPGSGPGRRAAAVLPADDLRPRGRARRGGPNGNGPRDGPREETHSQNPADVTSERWFRRLLRLLPFDFRADYGDEMTRVFEAERRAAVDRGGRLRV